MTSKNLFFNLMKEDIKRRLWSIAVITLTFFFLFPVWAALRITSDLNPEMIARRWDDTALGLELMKERLAAAIIDWTAIGNGLLLTVFVIFAVLCGVSGFSYLHSKQKTDFYHSLPVKRETFFAVCYIEGILYTAIPYSFNVLLAAAMIRLKAGVPVSWNTLLLSMVCHLAFYILIYTFAVLAVVLTGNTIVSLLGTAVFFIWGPALILMNEGYHSAYFKTFFSSVQYERMLSYTSPAAWYISAAVQPETAPEKAAGAVVAAFVIAAGALLLYKRRPSEAAGHAMAFKKSQAGIKFALVIPSALLGNLFFYTFKESDGWGIFGLLCGLFISYAVVEMIYHFDFRKLFSHRMELAVCMIFSIGFVGFFRFDWMGYDSYRPSAEKIESGSIYCYYLDSDALSNYWVKPKLQEPRGERGCYVNWEWSSEADLLREMKLSDVESVLKIADAGLKELEENVSAEYYNRYVDDEVRTMAVVGYHLKNGKTVFRRYSIKISEAEQALGTVYSDETYKKAVYPVLTWEAEDIAGINYQEYSEYCHVNLPDENMKKKLLETYQKELTALTVKVRKKEHPIGAVQFKTSEMQGMIDKLRASGGDFTPFNWKYYYPIYPSFTETIRLLKECGIDVGNYLNAENVMRMEISGYQTEPEDEFMDEAEENLSEKDGMNKDRNIEFTVTDKKQIAEILNAGRSTELNCENRLNPTENSIYITAYALLQKKGEMQEEYILTEDTENVRESEWSDEYEYDEEQTVENSKEKQKNRLETYSLLLDRDRIPEFIKKEFERR